MTVKVCESPLILQKNKERFMPYGPSFRGTLLGHMFANPGGGDGDCRNWFSRIKMFFSYPFFLVTSDRKPFQRSRANREVQTAN